MIDKIEQTKNKISAWTREFKKPAIMSSFGKDSMALLHLCRSMGLNLPVVFHRYAFMVHKFKFAESIIQRWKLEVYDWHPLSCSVGIKNDILDLFSEYNIGPNSTMGLPLGVLPYKENEPFVCGRDFLDKPKSYFVCPWDLLLNGQRGDDQDDYLGPISLKTDLSRNKDAASIAFPFSDWTKEEVWSYIRMNDIPVQADRYNTTEGTELKDKTYNSDWYPTCTACLDKRKADLVYCPKYNCMIPNVSAAVKEFQFEPTYMEVA